MGRLTSEYVKAIAGIGQYQGQEKYGTNQKQGLRFGDCSRLPEVDRKRNQPWPHTDSQAYIVHEKDTDSEKERPVFPFSVKVTPLHNKHDKG